MAALEEPPLTAEVRALREQGLAVKEIARILELRPAGVLAVLNAAVTAESPSDPLASVRCWVSPGWAREVVVAGHEDWPGLADGAESPGGLVCVLVARRHRHDKVSVCGFLVDVHCLGVKSAIEPRVMDEGGFLAFRRQFFGAYGEPLPAPLELARQLVLGGVAYARTLGFEPHPDFAGAAGHLDGPLTRCDIEFGRDGMPFYVEGPYDDARQIMRTLDASVGSGNYRFLGTVLPGT